MALNSTHPLYDAFRQDWQLMRHCYAGERTVKHEGVLYLKPTPGQILDGMGVGQVGAQNYEAYKERAVFFDYVTDAVKSYMGMLHQNPAKFELPPGMKSLIEKATINGESLVTLLRRINEEQLLTGRLGLLADLPFKPDPSKPMPYISLYIAESIINWDDSNDDEGKNVLDMVILNESSFERQENFVWKMVEKYRLLELGELTQPLEGEEGAEDVGVDDRLEEEMEVESALRTYNNGVYYVQNGSIDATPDKMTTPVLRGQTLDEIPFVMINSKDVVSNPDVPPLLGLANLSMTIYRGEADYRNQLFLQGQDTLVIINGDLSTAEGAPPVRVGAGASINLNNGGDAKYIGVGSTGLPEVRLALENDKLRAANKSSILAAGKGGMTGRESGDALRIRMAAQTATLTSIALAGAAGLEKTLKVIAQWLGEDPDKVKVTPNLEFTDFQVDGKQMVDLATARTMGAPISWESIHGIMVDRNLTQMSYEDEMGLIAEEDAGRPNVAPVLLVPGTGLPSDPKVPGAPPAAPAANPAPAPASK